MTEVFATMIVTCQQMRELEQAAFARGRTANALMEQAGHGIAAAVRQFFPQPGHLVLYLGTGNNAGDALVAARDLQKDGWQICARLSADPEQLKPLPKEHWDKLHPTVAGPSQVRAWTVSSPCVLLDGLLGIGARGPLQGVLRGLAAEMNSLRRECHVTTVALDVPSGIQGDIGQPCDDAVIADITVTIGHAKKGLLADDATAHVGRLVLVSLPDLAAEASGPQIITSTLLRPLLPRRSFDLHKGQAGRVAIIAGSRGYLGAAVLAALGALRGGAGLITLLAKPDAYDLLAAKLPPEIMVKPCTDYREAMTGYDVLAVGPGLGFEHEAEVAEIAHLAKVPVVLDADGLSILARQSTLSMQGPRLLTPHPGEMARLLAHKRPQPQGVRSERAAIAEAFASEHGVTLLLKGARTVIATPGQPTRYNTTGNPGMAAGGMGDVLSGLSAALIAQGMTVHNAASAGSWLLGRAAERAVSTGSEESLSPLDIVTNLGGAFADLKRGAL